MGGKPKGPAYEPITGGPQAFSNENIGYLDIMRCIGTVAQPKVQHPALLGDTRVPFSS